jgi:hypothetical protein
MSLTTVGNRIETLGEVVEVAVQQLVRIQQEIW